MERVEMSRLRLDFLILLLIAFSYQKLCVCNSIDSEGTALMRFRYGVKVDPYGALSNWGRRGIGHCFWFGVECSNDGRAVSLNLTDLCLQGKLTSDIARLKHLKSLILHNNSFSGSVPTEISKLLMLQVLDLGHNNLSGPFPYALLEIESLKVVVLKNNRFIKDISREPSELNVISKLQGDEDISYSNKGSVMRNIESPSIRRLLLQISEPEEKSWKHSRHLNRNIISAPSPSPISSPSPSPMSSPSSSPSPMSSPSSSPSPISSPSTSPMSSPSSSRSPMSSPSSSLSPMSSPSSSPSPISSPSPSPMSSSPSSSPSPSATKYQSSLLSPSFDSLFPVDQPYNELPHDVNSAPSPSPGNGQSRRPVYITVGAGIFALFSFSSVYFICCRTNKVENEPVKTGLSGKLQKALVMGVPSLQRSELQTACEEFSNVIDTLSDCTLYKGTLSNGVEIAVTSTSIKTADDWSDQSEVMFRDKISVLSKVNHKNFLNLIGYCQENEPFARMMVYEYAPNGTLFEHLHIKEAEPLNWTVRLRVAMGIAYCLDHLLRIGPPAILRSLNSSSIYLTEDYAAKVTDLSFWDEENEGNSSQDVDEPKSPLSHQEIVYKYGIVLLELISGRLPFSKDDGLLVLWASSHLTGKRPLKGIVDQNVESLTDDDISPLCEVVQSCVNPRPSERPAMAEVVAQLRKITGISPEGATPKLSPLWWAELEIIS